MLFPAAMLPFATVHAEARLGLSLLVAAMAALAVTRGLRRAPPTAVVVAAVLGAVAVGASALALLPVTAALRLELQPQLADAVLRVHHLASVHSAPLALDPHNALRELGTTAALTLLMVGAALRLRRMPHALGAARVLAASALVLVLIAAVHRVTGAERIWWVSEVPSFQRAAFLAPFVNPNHGGVACAALMPLALSLALRRGFDRGLGVAALLAIAVGLRLSGSRGALLAAGVAGLAWVALAFGPRARAGVGAVVVLVGVGVLVLGPDVVGGALSDWLVPEALGPGEDLYTGRGDIYRDAATLILAAPWVGVGGAGFDDGFRMVKSTPSFASTTHAHQELLQVAAEHGLPILALWVCFVGLVVARALVSPPEERSARRLLAGYGGAGAALLAACMFTFPLRVGALEVLAALVTGATLGLSGAVRERRPRGVRRLTAAAAVSLLVMGVGAPLSALWLADDADSPLGSADRAAARAGRALEAAKPGDRAAFLAAAADYKLALRRQPVNREALQMLSRAMEGAADRAHLGDLDVAVEALEVATIVYPTLPWTHRDLARLRRRLGDYDLARASWQRMLACDLPEGEEQRYVAEALQGPGDLVRIAGIALPERADRLAAGARVLEQAGEGTAAEALYRRAAALEPRFGAQLAAALNRWGRHDDALAALDAAEPSCLGARARAAALLGAERYAEAVDAHDRALSVCDRASVMESRQLRQGLARARMATGDRAAIGILEALVSADPTDVSARRDLVRAYRQWSRTPELNEQLRWFADNGQAPPREEEAAPRR